MQPPIILPETIFTRYDLSTLPIVDTHVEVVRQVLIHHYNTLTLRHVAETGKLMDAVDILMSLPATIKKLQDTHPHLFAKSSAVAAIPAISAIAAVPVASGSNADEISASLVKTVPTAAIAGTVAPAIAGPGNVLSQLAAAAQQQQQHSSSYPNNVVQLLSQLLQPAAQQYLPSMPGMPPSIVTPIPTPVPRKDGKAEKADTKWALNQDNVNAFVAFVGKNYARSATANVKFMDLLKKFGKSSNMPNIATHWHKNYENLCKALQLQVVRVPSAQYPAGGAYHTYLTPIDGNTAIAPIEPLPMVSTVGLPNITIPPFEAAPTISTQVTIPNITIPPIPSIPPIPPIPVVFLPPTITVPAVIGEDATITQ